MKLLKQLNTVEEMVKALIDQSYYYNCSLMSFEAHKDSYYNNSKYDVCISWWDYRGRKQPLDVIVRCFSENEQEVIYSKWWKAIEIAGGKSRGTYEEDQEVRAKRREFEHCDEANKDWMKALGCFNNLAK